MLAARVTEFYQAAHGRFIELHLPSLSALVAQNGKDEPSLEYMRAALERDADRWVMSYACDPLSLHIDCLH